MDLGKEIGMTAPEARDLESLSAEECIRLLHEHPSRVGRLAISGPPPIILPVNYAVDLGDVVFRTAPGTKLDAALKDSFVAFEVDDVTAGWASGWSVLVRGQAGEVTDPDEIRRLSRLNLYPWAAGTKDHFVRISNAIISGRRFV
jgi:nitroimidazol reductase NimA-like FMN-containing flavoprotein (pyridoxamine 5'-phosphate oxidase superfamily)